MHLCSRYILSLFFFFTFPIEFANGCATVTYSSISQSWELYLGSSLQEPIPNWFLQGFMAE